MSTMTIPAPSGSTDAAAPPVTTPDTSKTQGAPQAEMPAGSQPQGATPDGQSTDAAGTDESASGDDPSQERKSWKERRAERNRERWQEYKAAREGHLGRMARLEAEVARLKTAQAPDFSQIADPNEELAERTAWKVRQSQADDIQRQAEIERENARDALFHSWNAVKEDMRSRVPDFDQVVTDQTPIHPRSAASLVESDKGGEIAYFLGKNPDVARDLYAKFEHAPARAFIELGRIEERLKAPQAKTTSTAPRPASTLGGGANPLGFDPRRATAGDMADHLRKAGLIR